MPDLTITTRFNGISMPSDLRAMSAVGMLLDTALAFAAANFPDFQKFAVAAALGPPHPSPKHADLFRDLDPEIMGELLDGRTQAARLGL